MVDEQPCIHRHQPLAISHGGVLIYLRCLLTSFVISNMLTVALPPNTGLSISSALIIRLFFLSCRPFFLMYAHSFLVTSVRGIGFEPTTSDSTALGCTGFMKAAFGFRLLAAFFAMSSPCEVRPLWTPVLAAPIMNISTPLYQPSFPPRTVRRGAHRGQQPTAARRRRDR